MPRSFIIPVRMAISETMKLHTLNLRNLLEEVLLKVLQKKVK